MGENTSPSRALSGGRPHQGGVQRSSCEYFPRTSDLDQYGMHPRHEHTPGAQEDIHQNGQHSRSAPPGPRIATALPPHGSPQELELLPPTSDPPEWLRSDDAGKSLSPEWESGDDDAPPSPSIRRRSSRVDPLSAPFECGHQHAQGQQQCQLRPQEQQQQQQGDRRSLLPFGSEPNLGYASSRRSRPVRETSVDEELMQSLKAQGTDARFSSVPDADEPRSDSSADSAGELRSRLRAIRRFRLERTPTLPTSDRIEVEVEMAHRIWGCALVCVAFPLEDEVLVPYAVGRKEDTTVFAACLRALTTMVVMEGDVVVIPDGTIRLAQSEDAPGPCPPSLPFFAGAPIKLPSQDTYTPVTVGMICVLDSQKHRTFPDDDQRLLLRLAESVQSAIRDSFDSYRRQRAVRAQQAIISIIRHYSSETLRDPTAPGKEERNLEVLGHRDMDVDIFAEAAESLRSVLEADTCVILDVAGYRLVEVSSSASASEDQDPSIESAPLSPGPSREGNSGSSEPTSPSSDFSTSRRHSSSVTPAKTPARSKPSPGAEVPAVAPKGPSLTSEGSSSTRSNGTWCTFPRSDAPLPVLGGSGRGLERYTSISGKLIRPLVAQFFCGMRSSNSKSRAQAEGERYAGRASFIGRSAPLSGLLDDKAQALVAGPVFETDKQPSFLILVTFDEQPQLEGSDRLFIEEMGAMLMSSTVRARVRAVDRAQVHFMRKIQHELRTPSHAIIGVIEAAHISLSEERRMAQREKSGTKGPDRDDELATLLESISLSADSLNRVIEDIVDFGSLSGVVLKPSAAGMESHVSFGDLFLTVSEASASEWILFRKLERQKHGPRVKTPPPVEMAVIVRPFAFSSKQIKFDVQALQRVVTKLVSNSVRFTREGIIMIELILRKPEHAVEQGPGSPRRKAPHELELIVTDTGKGMSQHFVDEQLFVPWTKADAFTSGTGLSMTICASLVDQLGGRIKVTSQRGKGTRVTATFPIPSSLGINVSQPGSSKQFPEVNVAFLGYDSLGLRMLVDALTSQFAFRVTEDLSTAHLLLAAPEAVQKAEQQESLWKRIEGLSTRPEIFITPCDHLYNSEMYRIGPVTARVLTRPFLLQQLCDLQMTLARAAKRPKDAVAAAGRLDVPENGLAALSLNSAHSDMPSRSSSPMPPSRSSEGEDEISQACGDMAADPDHSFVVLVVEDNPLNARILTTLLKRKEIPYLEAHDGLEAVEKFRDHLPEVVLLDISMPVMDGFEACIEMRKVPSPYTHRIIAVTALSSESDKVYGRECGMDAWLVKPIRMGNLARDILREYFAPAFELMISHRYGKSVLTDKS